MIQEFDWGSHLPILKRVLEITDGDVLEMGMGIHSTPEMHWSCLDRNLVSYENDAGYYKRFKKFEDGKHKVIFVDDWDEAEIEKPWDVALVDHYPHTRRKEDVKRLSNWVKYLIVHDTDLFRYSEIYPLFKYRYDYKTVIPNTTVLSNFVSLEIFE